MLETELDFWREPAPGKTADILVSGDQMGSVLARESGYRLLYHGGECRETDRGDQTQQTEEDGEDWSQLHHGLGGLPHSRGPQ